MRIVVKRYAAVAIAMLFIVATTAPAFDKNQPKVLAAFRPVVEKASKCTVRVFSEGKRAALGVVVADDGYIITKASELHGDVECQLVDGRRAKAEVVGIERKLDLAMLKVDWKELPTIVWAKESNEPVGAWLITPGLERDPIGIGVVSAATRPIPRANGALGIVTQNAPGGGGVREVVPKGPAEAAGLQPGDIITKVGNKTVTSDGDLREKIFAYDPGDEVQLTVRRGSETFDLTLKLGSFQQIMQGERAEFQNSLGGQLSHRRAGFPLVLQHDTVLKPQDCGGPVLNINSEAVGLNIARAGRVETYALAASVIISIIDDMKAGKFAPPAKSQPLETADAK